MEHTAESSMFLLDQKYLCFVKAFKNLSSYHVQVDESYYGSFLAKVSVNYALLPFYCLMLDLFVLMYKATWFPTKSSGIAFPAKNSDKGSY